jgi:tripartite ATP-independent transporter DctM subunit
VSSGEVAALMFGTFAVLVALRIPVSFALGLACIPVFIVDDRLSPSLLMSEMWKSYNSFILLAVPFFLLAANLMNSAGITERLVNLAKATVGHLPGGLGHINVMVSMLFAGISGSSTADAAGIGSLLIPAMKKQGYDAPFSVAITACSSVMGVIIPPSILMVVWGGLMSVSIGGLFLAGVIPGVLIALGMMATVWVYARRRGYPMYERSSGRQFVVALGKAGLALGTPLIIIGGIVGGFFTPTEASVVTVIYSAVLGGLIYRSLGLKDVPTVLYESGRLASISLFCIGTASAFGWLLAYFRAPQALVETVLSVGLRSVFRRLVDRRVVPPHRHVHRRHSRHHYSGNDFTAGVGQRGHASDTFRHHWRDFLGVWFGHPALRALSVDIGGDRRSQSREGTQGCDRCVVTNAGFAPDGDSMAGTCALVTAVRCSAVFVASAMMDFKTISAVWKPSRM